MPRRPRSELCECRRLAARIVSEVDIDEHRVLGVQDLRAVYVARDRHAGVLLEHFLADRPVRVAVAIEPLARRKQPLELDRTCIGIALRLREADVGPAPA